MPEESVRKTAARKTVRKAVGRTAAVTRAPRTRRTAPEEVVEVATKPARPRRKAPTAVAATRPAAPVKNYFLYTGIAVFVLLFGMGAILGLTSDGAIDVGSIMNERIAAASPEERARLEQAQRATANQVPDGGLIASGVPETAAPASTSTELTASSTDANASSTATSTEAASADAAVPAVPDGGLVAPE